VSCVSDKIKKQKEHADAVGETYVAYNYNYKKINKELKKACLALVRKGAVIVRSSKT